jgi:hypothetical protein
VKSSGKSAFLKTELGQFDGTTQFDFGHDLGQTRIGRRLHIAVQAGGKRLQAMNGDRSSQQPKADLVKAIKQIVRMALGARFALPWVGHFLQCQQGIHLCQPGSARTGRHGGAFVAPEMLAESDRRPTAPIRSTGGGAGPQHAWTDNFHGHSFAE